MEKNLTPLMKQYWEIKSIHQDKIVFFRMGDFYELFYDDATTAAPLLGITLTQRNKKSEDQTPMCGMPHHSIANYINKLLALGHKVALCDQIEDPKLAKGLVKRAITRILTPGMVYDPETLDATQSNYMCSIDEESISFVDVSTGECFYYLSELWNEKIRLLKALPVVEVVVSSDLKNRFDDIQLLISEFAFELENKSELPKSALRLLKYIESLSQSVVIQTLRPFVQRDLSHRMKLGQKTIRHLEIFENYQGQSTGSFFDVINKTKTSSGARLLRQNILFPLRSEKEILSRQSIVQKFKEHLFELKKTREHLASVGDLERRFSKLTLPQVNARDLFSLSESLKASMAALEVSQKLFTEIKFPQVIQLVEDIQKTLHPEAPLSVKQGHIINRGVSVRLDELIDLSTNSQKILQDLETRERELTGISSLKIRYNNVFGYYIEVTNTHKDKAPDRYQRKQTLATAERFTTDELTELEKKVITAQTQRNDLEFEIFEKLKNQILSLSSEVLQISKLTSELDFYTSLAWLSLEKSYSTPIFSKKRELQLIESRHPVVENFRAKDFVANTVQLSPSQTLMITGPNMAGKSTLMRQVSLIALLAQIGSDVPCQEALLPLYDSILTRIGASDQLSEGLSTFMVEMTETAELLAEATNNSLLIIDEIGRGTATFDGMCLAQSILEYLVQKVQSHTFFATHYHELTDLENKYPGQIKNAHLKIKDLKDKIEFLYVLTPGSAGKSYGIQVAELAGLPKEVTELAKKLLHKMEGDALVIEKSKSEPSVVSAQASFFDAINNQSHQKFIQELEKFEVMKSSPLEALNQISKWKSEFLN